MSQKDNSRNCVKLTVKPVMIPRRHAIILTSLSKVLSGMKGKERKRQIPQGPPRFIGRNFDLELLKFDLALEFLVNGL